MNSIIMTKKDVAALLAISTRHLERLIKAKKFLQPSKLGDLVRFRTADVLAWIEQNMKPGASV